VCRTLQEFATRFVEGHAVANRHKPSGIASKETVMRMHLIPALGNRRLDAITNEDVQQLKAALRGKARKTVNNGRCPAVETLWSRLPRPEET
jgi:hypothetical protein